MEQLEDRIALSSTYQSIGPAPIAGVTNGDGGNVSGRITAIVNDPNDSTGNTVYIGGAGGGVWEGQNIHSTTPKWIDLTGGTNGNNNLAKLTGDPFINSNVGALFTVKGTGAQTGETILYVGLGEANAFTNLMTPGSGTTQFYGAGLVQMVIDPATASVVSATVLGNTPKDAQGNPEWQLNQFYGVAFSKIVGTTSGGVIYAAVSTAKNGVTGNEGIYRSLNGGAWTNITASIAGSTQDEFSDLAMLPTGTKGNVSTAGNVLYAAIGQSLGSPQNGVWMTTNAESTGNVTWTEMTNLPDGTGVGRITLALSGNVGPTLKSPYTPAASAYELYAAFMTTAQTQVATRITSATVDAGGNVILDFSSFQGLQQFTVGQTVDVEGIGDSADYNYAQTITKVSYNAKGTTGSLTYSIGSGGGDDESGSLDFSNTASVSSQAQNLYQLGYAVVLGNSSNDTTTAFNIVHGSKGNVFDLPVPNTAGNNYNYVGFQGAYGTALAAAGSTYQNVLLYAGGQDKMLQITTADASSSQVINMRPYDVLSQGNILTNAVLHVDQHALLLDPASNAAGYTLLSGNDGGIYEFNPNAGKDKSGNLYWTDLNGTGVSGLQLTQIYGLAGNPSNSSQILGGAQDNGNFQTLNTAVGLSWNSITAGDGGLTYFDPNSNTAFFNNTSSLEYATNPYQANPAVDGINTPNNPSKLLQNFPSAAYSVSPVTVNGTPKDYIWYGGVNTSGSIYPSYNALLLGVPTTKGGVTTWKFAEVGSPTSSNWPATQTTSVNGFQVDDNAVDSVSASVTYNASAGFQSIVYVTLRGGEVLVSSNCISPETGAANPNATWTVTTPAALNTTTTITAVGTNTITVNNAAGFPTSGNLFVETDPTTDSWTYVTYTGISGNMLTGVSSFTGSLTGLSIGDTVGYQNDLKYSSIAIDTYNSNIAFITAANFGSITGGGHVWMTTNGGQTWTNISGSGNTGLPNLPTWSLAIQQPNSAALPVLYVGTDLGVYWSTNLGATWSVFGPTAGQPGALPNVQARTLSLDMDAGASMPSPELFVGTLGHSAYEITPGTGTPTITTFIESVYLHLLNRPADPGGLAGWTNLLNSLGNTTAARTQVASAIQQSQEYLDDAVTALYHHYLNRAPDPAGLANWVSALEGGATFEQVTAGIAGSPEFFQDQGGTNGDFVNALYADILGRHADAAGFNSWVIALINDASTTTVAYDFLTTTEYRQDLVAGVGWTPSSPTASPPSSYFQGYYLSYLGRQGDPAGVAGWLAALQQGQPDQQVIAGFLGSQEFYDNSI